MFCPHPNIVHTLSSFFFLSRTNLTDLDVMHHILFDIIWDLRPVFFSCQRICVRLISLSDKNQQT